jgi:hypothetical protein
VRRRWLVLLAAVGVATVGVVVLLLRGGHDGEIERGAVGFPVAGSLASDDGLIEKAVDAWTEHDDRLEGTFRVLWAGSWHGGRMVVLDNRNKVASVVFGSHDSDGSVRADGSVPPAFGEVVRVDRGLLIADDAPTSYTAVFQAGSRDVKTKRVVARDRLIDVPGFPAAMLADDPGDRVPLILNPEIGSPTEVTVEAADLPAMRRALLDSGNGIVTATALENARQKNRLEASGRIARVLHVGPVPGGGTGVAAYIQDVDESAIAFAWSQGDSVAGQPLAVVDQSPSRASLAAAKVDAGPSGQWLVVAGDEGVARIVVEVGRRVIRRRGSFALLRATDLGRGRNGEIPPVSVRGYTADGNVVPARGL